MSLTNIACHERLYAPNALSVVLCLLSDIESCALFSMLCSCGILWVSLGRIRCVRHEARTRVSGMVQQVQMCAHGAAQTRVATQRTARHGSVFMSPRRVASMALRCWLEETAAAVPEVDFLKLVFISQCFSISAWQIYCCKIYIYRKKINFLLWIDVFSHVVESLWFFVLCKSWFLRTLFWS